MEQGLSNTPASELDKFIEDHLQPNTSFCNEVRVDINIICDFLKERCFQGTAHPVRVSKVVKGGSSGKGKMLKGRFEADLVVFLNNLTSFEDQLKRRREFLKEIENQLCQLQGEKKFPVKLEVLRSWRKNSPGLILRLSSPQHQQEVEFDVLLAYDLLGSVCFYSKPDPEIYRKFISECTSLRKVGEFSTCFTELQRNFLKHRPTKLKSLIHLVKHWYQLCKEKLGEPLPPQYALELLTVYAWERGSGATEFNTAQGFRTVLELVTKHRQLRIYWRVYYDFQHQYISDYLHRQLGRARPVILDPADPTRNVAGGNPEAWWRLAGEATAWLQCQCSFKCCMPQVGSWNVLVSPCPHLFPLHTALVTPSLWRIFSQRCDLLLKVSTLLGRPAASLFSSHFSSIQRCHRLARWPSG
ncbi:2'-5'-oligoadenylate synthase 1A-like isoform X3 [Peromyscus californicus insignis]|uniref:2'-5'-oligoadenylate synthase 1A-like isoform X3 n=1 Tax=Peromyscus californicus insignis TaxID=564181 RepID=UPI0022A7E20D|nr:2'-5'-oligoadenylate synthase 1A-like isoform X3 [Peromyscus californicus insignis]